MKKILIGVLFIAMIISGIPVMAQVNATTMEKSVINLVNVERSKRKLPMLKLNVKLGKTARIKAEDMKNKNYFSHISPTYGSPFSMMTKFGISYTATGENIAYGQRTPAAVMKAWMNSPGHRQNILNPAYTDIGVGFASKSNGVTYWVQQFIRR